jgi:arylformamidase
MKKGVTVFLDAPIETLKEHLSNSSTQRPLLKIKTIEQIYNERIELYRKFADVTISYNSYIEAADKIMEIINGKLKKKILVINGPNLNMLGLRDPKHYGTQTLDEINNMIKEETALDFEFFQSNHEGAIVDKIQEYKKYDGIIINPAAYTHTSVAIHDALEIIVKAKKQNPEAAKRILIKGCAEVSSEAAKIFASSKILLLGNESQTVGPEDAPMEVHHILLSASVILLEGIRLAEVSEGVYFLNAAPLNLSGADGSPCRAILIDMLR